MHAMLQLIVAVTLVQNPAPAPAPSAAGRLAGQVTVEGTNAPLADARVMLFPGARPTPMTMPYGPPPQTTTDQNGRFAFSGLKPGEYRIDVQRTGYAPLEDTGRGRTIQLAEGQSIDNFAIQLQKGAVITGRIVSPSGEPQSDVRVMALRRFSGPGTQSRLIPAPMQGMQQTNDLGEFRLSGLPPGEYYVSAAPHMPSPFGGPGVMPPPAQGTARTTLATTYYPGTTDAATAQPIAVARGAEVGNISFMLLTLPAFRVSGIVVDEKGSPIAGAMIMLMSDPRNGTFMGPAGNGRSGEDGRFAIDNVVAGTYRASASVPIAIGGPGAGGMVSWSSGGSTTVSPSGGVSGGVVIASSGAGQGVVPGGGWQADPPTEVVVGDSNVAGVRIVTRRPQ
ncbi:MAG TPA: carboxypeptidase-like regulatory domain-containing protein [Vicinamibacterales bacterium]|nr:carboxypeptidase-like regulatory domain-containing protein [Vicinamibacterales bacterium]